MGQCYLKGENSGSSNENVYASGQFRLEPYDYPYRTTTVTLPFAPKRIYFERHSSVDYPGYMYDVYTQNEYSGNHLKITGSDTTINITPTTDELCKTTWDYHAFAE